MSDKPVKLGTTRLFKMPTGTLSFPRLERPEASSKDFSWSASVSDWRWPEIDFLHTSQVSQFWEGVEKELRRLLGMWVSELEPVLVFGPGKFLGLGAEGHGVILPAGRWKVRAAANYEEDEKTAYDLAYVAGYKDRVAGIIHHRPEIHWALDPWPNAAGAGYSEGMHDAAEDEEAKKLLTWAVEKHREACTGASGFYRVPPGATPFVFHDRYRKD